MTMVFQANSLHKQDSQSAHLPRLDEGYALRTEHSRGSLSELPGYNYPVPIFVKNTFIDIQLERTGSLDEFMEQRKIHSCPPQTVEASDVTGPDSEESQEPLSTSHGVSPGAEPWSATSLTLAANSAAVLASQAVSSFRNWWNPVPSFALPVDTSSGHPHQYVAQKMPNEFGGECTLQVICLANALGEPALGSSEFPTIGSAGHTWGTCKPCAFLYKRGCQNGVQCEFCHLCDEGEKKRRQKEKITRLKEMRGVA